MLFGILLLSFLGFGIPSLFSYFVWRVFGLDKATLSVGGAVAVFIPGALTSWVFWGHAGPMPALMVLLMQANGEYLRWALWMIGSGLCMVTLFGWLSYRRSRARAA